MRGIDERWISCVPHSDLRTPVEAGLFRDIESGMLVRDRGHVGIILEQEEWRPVIHHYIKNGIQFREETILDLGGHIGAAMRFFHAFVPGMKRVVSVEPDPNNCMLYRRNMERLFKTENDTHLIQGAVVTRENLDPDLHERAPLFLGKTYSASNTLFPVRGRDAIEVDVFDFEFLVDLYKPTLIKCDIEGSEYLINWANLNPCVQEIAMELHFNRPDWENEMIMLQADLMVQGFKAIKPPKVNDFRKVCTAIWTRRL